MWMYLQFPTLLLDRMQVLQPELKALPAVLFHAQEQRVMQTNAVAEGLGIQRGNTLSDAWLLADTLRTFRWREARQRHLLQQVATDLYQVFGVISLDPPFGLWLDLTPMRKLYPEPQQNQLQLQQQLAPWQLRYQSGVGVTPLQAKMVAQSQVTTVADIPIGYLPCPQPLQEKLQRMGLHTLGALQAIPRALAGRRLGKELVVLLARIQGEQRENLHFFRPPVWFFQRLELTAEVNHWQALRFPLNRLLQDLEHFLESRQQETRQLLLTLYHRDEAPTELALGFAHGSYLAHELAQFCQLKMEHCVLVAPVLELSLQARQLQPRHRDHGDLLKGPRQHKKSLPRLLNELQLRLGQQRVWGIQNRADWLPEQAWHKVPAGQPLGQAHIQERPLWLFPEPRPVQIQHWVLLRGPERFTLPWWVQDNEHMCDRDYWKARHRDGQPGWLFYEHQQGCWWQHGWFS
ncbi:Y-family DNA polymerase [Aliidiomarina indica]|uniref:Y-family DNA polymerase n=1 Tax=Aliidiomarina indica TaxID=2749147 RepID=UPI00188E58C3|nr:DNA polymerase Y family protein [Aliidiomarina indica]